MIPFSLEETNVKTTPPHPSPPKLSHQPLVVEPYQGQAKAQRLSSVGRSKSLDTGNSDGAQVGSSDETGNGQEQPFHRQYAKRGMKFKARLSDGNVSRPPTVGSDQILRHPHLNALNSREDELRTPSPYSWQSSPGTSPPTSPMLTPRSSR